MKTPIRFLMSVVMLICMTIPANAFTYYITFTGSGASTTVDSVIVQNLSKGTQVIVPTGFTLKLYDVESSIDGISTSSDFAGIYPNPLTDVSTFTFMAKNGGNSHISVYKLDGTKTADMDADLEQGKNSFQITLPTGVYLVQAKGNDFSYTAKVISLSKLTSEAKISFSANSTRNKPLKAPVPEVKLQYNTGDQILYKGYSGNYCTIVTDKPTETKTTDFKFVACTDADGNHYAVVHIGTQTWMAENLKTTKYQNGVSIGTTTPATKDISSEAAPKYQWTYNGIENNAAKYGRLYTWYAATDARNIAPVGWHVASDDEWNYMKYYLMANGYNYDGTKIQNRIAKSLAATTDWKTDTGTGTIGNDLSKNNSSGFTALPGGMHDSGGRYYYMGDNGLWWSTTENDTSSAIYKGLFYNNNSDLYTWALMKSYGFSVRCLRYEETNQINIETVSIPAGTFTMGSPETEVDRYEDETQHQVTLSAFRMSKYEITNAQYADFLNAKGIGSNGISSNDTSPIIYASSGLNDFGLHYTGSQWIPVAGYENHPVFNASWYGAAEFAAYVGGALPTEAQWEYACRGGTTTPFNTGSCLTNLQANYNWSGAYYTCENSVNIYPGKTQAVGTYPPNGYGLFDMHGNVWEFCADWYERNYPTTPQTNPTGPVTGGSIVMRGGGWAGYARYCRSAQRSSAGGPSSAKGGFRVVFVP